MADVLVLSLYQPQCQEISCDWTGVVRSSLDDACRDAESHDTAHRLREEAARLRAKWPSPPSALAGRHRG